MAKNSKIFRQTAVDTVTPRGFQGLAKTAMPPFLNSLKSLFRPRPAKRIGDSLYVACVTQSRLPVFYIDYGVEDAIGARFELLTFHVGLVVTRLKSLPADDPRHDQAQEVGQALFDAFLLALDSALREQGVGDLSVPKKMKTLGQVIYTRMKRWDDIWRHSDGLSEAADYTARTIMAGVGYDSDTETADDAQAPIVAPIAASVLERAQAFAIYALEAYDGFTMDSALEGRLAFPEPAILDTESKA